MDAAIIALARRPLAAMAPEDLILTNDLLRHTGTDAAARPFLDLLRSCLRDRFGADVALADAVPAVPAVGDDLA